MENNKIFSIKFKILNNIFHLDNLIFIQLGIEIYFQNCFLKNNLIEKGNFFYLNFLFLQGNYIYSLLNKNISTKNVIITVEELSSNYYYF